MIMTNIDHHGFSVLRKFDSIDYCDFHDPSIIIPCPTLPTMSFIPLVILYLLMLYLLVAGVDYMLPLSVDITFPRGQREVLVPITIVDDNNPEGNGSFTVALTSDGDVVFTQQDTTVIIIDNDGKPVNKICWMVDKILEVGYDVSRAFPF